MSSAFAVERYEIEQIYYELAFGLDSVINDLAVLSGNGEIAVRLGAALVIGSALELNRDLHGKPAGVRTHGLVTLGATMIL